MWYDNRVCTLANEGVRVNLHPSSKLKITPAKYWKHIIPMIQLDRLMTLQKQRWPCYCAQLGIGRVTPPRSCLSDLPHSLDNNARSAAFGGSSQLSGQPSHFSQNRNYQRPAWQLDLDYTPQIWQCLVGTTTVHHESILSSGVTAPLHLAWHYERNPKGKKPICQTQPSDVIGTSICTVSDFYRIRSPMAHALWILLESTEPTTWILVTTD